MFHLINHLFHCSEAFDNCNLTKVKDSTLHFTDHSFSITEEGVYSMYIFKATGHGQKEIGKKSWSNLVT